MRQHINNASARETEAYPYVVVLDNETIPQAIARHRRDTGHRGLVTIMDLPKRRAA